MIFIHTMNTYLMIRQLTKGLKDAGGGLVNGDGDGAVAQADGLERLHDLQRRRAVQAARGLGVAAAAAAVGGSNACMSGVSVLSAQL
jgi:hypothetical protein